MSTYYYPYSTPGSGSSRASSGSPLSSDSTGYFSPAPPSPYYYTPEYTSSPSSTTTNDSYQGSISSSRSSSSQGHYRHPSSSSSSSSSSFHHLQASTHDHQQYDGRASKRQRAAALVDPTGYLQPHWMDMDMNMDMNLGMGMSQDQLQGDFATGVYQQQHSQMPMSYASPTGHHGYAYPVSPSRSSPQTNTSATAIGRRSSPNQTGQPKAHSEGPEGEGGEPFEHGPTELPPRTFVGHSKFNPPKKPGKIPGSAMDYLPVLEARFERLENAIDRYIDYRGQRALSNSILPGSKESTTSGTKTR